MSDYGFFRVAACVPEVKVGRPMDNAAEIIRLASDADEDGAQAICFPELCLTGCTLGDLVRNSGILAECRKALEYLKEESRHLNALIAVGIPIEFCSSLYDAYAVILNGRILGISVNHFPSDNRNFTNCQWPLWGNVQLCGEDIPFGDCITYDIGGASISVRSVEDLSFPGSEIVLCPAGYTETAGRKAHLEQMSRQRSADFKAAVITVSAGHGESTTDYVYAGHQLIAENGVMIGSAHNKQGILVADIDLELLHNSRISGIVQTVSPECDKARVIDAEIAKRSVTSLKRYVNPAPFNTSDDVFCETFSIQTSGLVTRLEHTGIRKMVIGISGGLDSTLALLVCANAADSMGIGRKSVIGITMPGFGTTDRTYSNAVGMMKALGIEWREISIKEAALLHLRDIGHDPDIHDSAYENTQARERTQILMDIANETGALAVGTGDLSELALGWCTYNGDHMSMYAVNASIPKTMISGIISYAAGQEQFSAAKANLLDVIDTPISPELLPSDARGHIVQKTEEIIGPYELHDFFIYHLIKNGFQPEKIEFLASQAFGGKYEIEVIDKWLRLFLKRFSNNQFKRSCMPDGPCCGPVSLSPRGGWSMPSDISVW